MNLEAALKEYEVGNAICTHYESLRRDGLVFSVTVQGVVASVLFGVSEPSNILTISLCVFAVFVALLSINNDIRMVDYYFAYSSRLAEIEQELGMRLYSVKKPAVMKSTRALPNVIFFRGLALLAALFWPVYLVYALVT